MANPNVAKLAAQIAAVPPKAPSIEEVLMGKENAALAAAAVPTWEETKNAALTAFYGFGQAGAAGAVSTTQAAHMFAAAVASGHLYFANGASAYLFYAKGWNDHMKSLPEETRGEYLDVEGETFKSASSSFATFGLIGAVAQGATPVEFDAKGKVSRVDWSTHFYKRISAIYASVPKEERAGSYYSAMIACNRAAHKLLDIDDGWKTPQLSDDAIRSICTRKASDANQIARGLKMLGNAAKAFRKADCNVDVEIGIVSKAVEALYDAQRAIEAAAQRAGDMIHERSKTYEPELIKAHPANEMPAE